MSWLALDSKGDLARNYGTIAKTAMATMYLLLTCEIPPAQTAITC